MFGNKEEKARLLMSSAQSGAGNLKLLLDPVREGIQALEQAGLVLRIQLGEGSFYLKPTRLGETALAGGPFGST